MMRVGLIRNVKSYRNRKPDEAFRRAAQQWLGATYAEPSSIAELPAILSDFQKRDVDLIVVDGGDGTLHKILSALPDEWEKTPPCFAVLPSGNTNLVAADIGMKVRGVAGLKRIIDAAAEGDVSAHIKRRNAIDVEWVDGSHPRQRGMFFGAAAFTRGTDIAHDGVHKKGLFQKSAVMLTVGVAFAQLLKAESRERWLAGEAMSANVDMKGARKGHRFLFLATGLQKMFFGIWPFWGGENAGLRYLDVDARPKNLLKAGASLLRGNASQWIRDSEQYRSGGAERIGLKLAHRFVLDGEVFEPGPGEHIVLKAGPSLRFVAL